MSEFKPKYEVKKFGVDSGTFVIVDPCYLYRIAEEFKFDRDIVSLINKLKVIGVVVETGADGEYSVLTTERGTTIKHRGYYA